ncbi:MAG: HAD-IIIA family hydrolase [Clostridia bacterium]|nr:HAD-IIIA family hydrolase [Clostridia bacterium]
MKNKIQFLIMDVDGTLTDGKINIGDEGEVYKSFSVKDGYAINQLLPRYGIEPVIITGRNSKIVQYRANELSIKYLFQGCDNKISTLENLLREKEASFENCAYIGDDMNDYDCMLVCKERGCPMDAVDEIKSIATYVCKNKGGEGAVREFVEYLIGSRK